MEKIYESIKIWNGFGYNRTDVILNDFNDSTLKETIKGITFYAFNKKFITVAFAKDGWVDDNGVYYRCKIVEGVFYTKKIAIGLK